MIPFLIYFFILIGLIYKNRFFGFFDDHVITRKYLSVLFFLKCLAIPAFYLVYEKVYGGVSKFDSGKFFHDTSIISDIAKKDLLAYLKLLIGFQSDDRGTYDFLLVQNTFNWDNGEIKDFLYNDNRVLIRIHSLVHFISFNSFFVHALFSCFISFVGLFSIYKTFKSYLIGKENVFLLLICLFPALWFYTGAPLKEGLSIFVLGRSLFLLKKLVTETLSWKTLLWLLFFIWMSLLLKPYLLFLALFCFYIFFKIEVSKNQKFKLARFILIIVCGVILLNLLSIFIKHKSLSRAALDHQRIFAGVAKGGIFLYDDKKFIRLPVDTSLMREVKKSPSIYTINKGSSYMYWQNRDARDTLYCAYNLDTLTRYQLAYILPQNQSNLQPILYSEGFVSLVLNSYYYSFAYPFFFNAKSSLQILASIENLLLLFSLFIILLGLFKNNKSSFLPIVLLVFAFSICLLIGIATPNSGAIFRYRSPAMIFVLLAALYYLELSKLKIFKRNL